MSSPTVRVVSGNDLTVEALLSVYDEGKGYYAAFDLSEASDVRMRIVGTYNRVDGESVCNMQHADGCFFAKLIPWFIDRRDSSSVVLF